MVASPAPSARQIRRRQPVVARAAATPGVDRYRKTFPALAHLWVLLLHVLWGSLSLSRTYASLTATPRCSADCKSRGWNWEASKLRDRNRLNRLLLALVLALWCHLLCIQVIRRGLRRQCDCTDRRDLSVVRLVRRWMAWLLAHDRLPPLPFRQHDHTWSWGWCS